MIKYLYCFPTTIESNWQIESHIYFLKENLSLHLYHLIPLMISNPIDHTNNKNYHLRQEIFNLTATASFT